MNESKKLLISLTITTLFVLISYNIYSQKWKINRDTGDSTLTHLIITSNQGHVGTNHYYIRFQKYKDRFILKLRIEKDMSGKFFLAEEKPMEILLSSNDTLKIYSYYNVQAKGYNLLEGIFDKESTLDYDISLDDIHKIRDNDYIWIKIYYVSQLDRKLVQTEQDEIGYYFRLKHAKKDRKRKNRKKTEHIMEFLDAL